MSSVQKENISFVKGFKLLLKNNYWLIICGYLGMHGTWNVPGHGRGHLLCQVDSGQRKPGRLYYGGIHRAGAGMHMPAVAPLSKNTGKRDVAFVGSIISLVGRVLILMNPTSGGWLIMLPD